MSAVVKWDSLAFQAFVTSESDKKSKVWLSDRAAGIPDFLFNPPACGERGEAAGLSSAERTVER